MVYTDMVQVLTASEPRMNLASLFEFSHREDGFSFYRIRVKDSDEQDMVTIAETLTRQGIAANIFPDRLQDKVTSIRYSPTGALLITAQQYLSLLTMINNTSIEGLDKHYVAYIDSVLNQWDNQVRHGNIYSLSQFMAPQEEG